MIISLKRNTLKILEAVGEYTTLLVEILVILVRRPPSASLIREQLYHIGVLSFSVVATTGFTTGFVLAAQAFYQLGEKGLSGVTGILVAKSMITELGPILTAFMVTGRVGSSICAEIGSMKVTEQIDALRSMAVNPIQYLIAPRVLAGMIAIPLLSMFGTAMGITGGYLIAVTLFNIPGASYFAPMPLYLCAFDVATGIIKSFIFGFLLITICCQGGLKASGGATGVGKATTESVVLSYILILISDLLLTIALNSIYKGFTASGF